MSEQWMVQKKIDEVRHDLEMWFPTINKTFNCFPNPNPRRHVLSGEWLFVITSDPYNDTLTLQGRSELEALQVGYDWARMNIPAAADAELKKINEEEIEVLTTRIQELLKGKWYESGPVYEDGKALESKWVVNLNPFGYIRDRVYGYSQIDALRKTVVELTSRSTNTLPEFKVGDEVNIYGRRFVVESFLDDVPDGPRVLLTHVPIDD